MPMAATMPVTLLPGYDVTEGASFAGLCFDMVTQSLEECLDVRISEHHGTFPVLLRRIVIGQGEANGLGRGMLFGHGARHPIKPALRNASIAVAASERVAGVWICRGILAHLSVTVCWNKGGLSRDRPRQAGAVAQERLLSGRVGHKIETCVSRQARRGRGMHGKKFVASSSASFSSCD